MLWSACCSEQLPAGRMCLELLDLKHSIFHHFPMTLFLAVFCTLFCLSAQSSWDMFFHSEMVLCTSLCKTSKGL